MYKNHLPDGIMTPTCTFLRQLSMKASFRTIAIAASEIPEMVTQTLSFFVLALLSSAPASNRLKIWIKNLLSMSI